MKLFTRERPKVALVLGGGSARGLAHLGCLQVLEREGITCDLVVGASIGSLLGAIYALGIPLAKAEKRALRTDWRDIVKLRISKFGLSDGRGLEQIIREEIEDKKFEDLKIPLAVVTTDIERGEEVVFTSGPLSKVILASCSLPGIFAPVRIGDKLLLDGGIKHTVPVGVARRLGATFVIACDVGFCVRTGKIQNVFQILVQAFQIKGQELNYYQSMTADVVIRPDLKDIDQASFHRGKEAMDAGVKATEEAMAELKRKLKFHSFLR
ncbi:MAG: patatin-like phospholipase family protein [Candidatus Omnitrophica bacterium]|nr:patatin-like phospholipase family protein [Candidatus Omnitrophota bacterium]